MTKKRKILEMKIGGELINNQILHNFDFNNQN